MVALHAMIKERRFTQSFVIEDEYAADHDELRRSKELQLAKLYFQSPQLQFRSYLVTWIRAVSEKLKFSISTVYLGVYLLDVFMDNHNIDVHRLQLVAIVCLHLAAKYEEQDQLIPKITDMYVFMSSQVLPSDFTNMQKMVLVFLDWSLDYPTASHFAEYYSLFAVHKEDWDKKTSYETFWQSVQHTVAELLDLCLLEARMLNFLPSVVACSCIMVARQKLLLRPRWTHKLLTITSYNEDDLKSCSQILLKKIKLAQPVKRKLPLSPDQGYGSSGSSGYSPEGTVSKHRKL